MHSDDAQKHGLQDRNGGNGHDAPGSSDASHRADPEEELARSMHTMLKDGGLESADGGAIFREKHDIDYSCLEESEDHHDDMEDLDPSTFRQFVEDCAERMSSAGSLTPRMTLSPSSQSLENDGSSTPVDSIVRHEVLAANARLTYNRLVGIEAWLVIRIAPPFSILAASPAFTELLGYTEREIVGRALRVIQGPHTNVKDLHEGIKNCEPGGHFTGAFMFYTKRSEGRLLTIDVVYGDNDEHEDEDEEHHEGPDGAEGVAHAVVTMDHSDWVPKKIALAEDSRIKVVILADKPYTVVSISNNFTAQFQMPESIIVGRTIRAIFGPKTDQTSFYSSVTLAKTGRTQNLELWTCRADASELKSQVTMFPVAEEGRISHMMMVIKEVKDMPQQLQLSGAGSHQHLSDLDKDSDDEGEEEEAGFGRVCSSSWLAGARDPKVQQEQEQQRQEQEQKQKQERHLPPTGQALAQRMSELSRTGMLLEDEEDEFVGSPVAGAKPDKPRPLTPEGR